VYGEFGQDPPPVVIVKVCTAIAGTTSAATSARSTTFFIFLPFPQTLTNFLSPHWQFRLPHRTGRPAVRRRSITPSIAAAGRLTLHPHRNLFP